jgi:DNA polymerase-3 subunit epsilon
MGWKNIFSRNPSGRQLPSCWQDYLALNKNGQTRKTALKEVDFVVFDTETTGLDYRKDRILSFGAVRVYQQMINISDTFECIVHQQFEPEQETIAVHGILPEESLSGLAEATALEAFLQYIGSAVLVGHNVFFDISIVNQALKRQFGVTLKNKHLDTRQLAIRLEYILPPSVYDTSQFTLDALSKRFQLPASDRHTAAGDAFITGILLMKLLHRFEARGNKTLGSLLKWS